jgi:hypothetical protein
LNHVVQRLLNPSVYILLINDRSGIKLGYFTFWDAARGSQSWLFCCSCRAHVGMTVSSEWLRDMDTREGSDSELPCCPNCCRIDGSTATSCASRSSTGKTGEDAAEAHSSSASKHVRPSTVRGKRPVNGPENLHTLVTPCKNSRARLRSFERLYDERRRPVASESVKPVAEYSKPSRFHPAYQGLPYFDRKPHQPVLLIDGAKANNDIISPRCVFCDCEQHDCTCLL